MPKAYSFIQFSRPRQMRADTRRWQVEAARAWASEHGLELDETLADQGWGNSPGKEDWVEGSLAAFLLLVQTGKVEKGAHLIVEKLGRLSRKDVDEAMPRFLELMRAGVTIVTLDDRQEHTAERVEREPTSLTVSLLVSAQAQAKSRLKAESLGETWQRKRADAGSSVITARLPAWLTVRTVRGKRRIKPIPERADVVRRIFNEVCNGDGRRRIAGRLNQEGVPTFGAKRWHDSYIKKLIENKAVYGEHQGYRRRDDGVRVPDGEPVRNYYPVVIEREQYDRANEVKAGLALSAGRPGHEFTNVLQRLVRCGCGARMIRENKGAPPKGGTFLVCAEARRQECENARRWPLADTERLVIRNTSRLNLDAILPRPEEGTNRDRAADLAMRIEDLRRRRSRLLDLVEEGDEEAKERARVMAVKIKALTAREAELRHLEERTAAEPPLAERQGRLRELLPLLDTATGGELFELRSRVAKELRSLLRRIVFGERGITVFYRTHWPTPGVVFHRRHKNAVAIFNDDPEDVADVERVELHPGLLEERVAAQEQAARFFAAAAARAEVRTAMAKGKGRAKRTRRQVGNSAE